MIRLLRIKLLGVGLTIVIATRCELPPKSYDLRMFTTDKTIPAIVTLLDVNYPRSCTSCSWEFITFTMAKTIVIATHD